MRSRGRLAPTQKGRGFTLIELLVVIVIVGVLTTAVALNLNFTNVSKSVRDESLRVALLLQMASDTAIYSRQQLGIRFHPESYEFYILADAPKPAEDSPSREEPAKTDKQKQVWAPLDDERLSMREPKVEVEFEVEIEGLPIVLETLEEEQATLSGAEAEPIKPHILLLSNGEIMPDYRIVVRDADKGEFEHQVYTGEEEPIVVEAVE